MKGEAMSIEFERARSEIRKQAETLSCIERIEDIIADLICDESKLEWYLLNSAGQSALLNCFAPFEAHEHIKKYRSVLANVIIEDLSAERKSLISKVCANRERKEDAQQ